MVGHCEGAVCPHCGKSNYDVVNESVTLVCVRPGTPEEDNPNIVTEHCQCNECGECFDVERRGGRIIRVSPCGNSHDAPTGPSLTLPAGRGRTSKWGIRAESLSAGTVSCGGDTTIPLNIDVENVVFLWHGKKYRLSVGAFLKAFCKEEKE